MARIKFKKDFQTKFLTNIQKSSGLGWPDLAERLEIHKRTLFDWRKEKYTISENAFKKCLKLSKNKIDIPRYKVLPDFWSIEKAARKGGLVVAQKYGGPGTPKGRKRGGLVSQRRRRLYPERYQQCNIRKRIIKPSNIPLLAEFFGIVLGDGGINSDHQVVITVHRKDGKEYTSFICDLAKRLFSLVPAVYRYRSLKSKNVVGITISSIALVEFLLSKGLKKGNKVRQQVNVPSWIKKDPELSRGCLRGLIDTDGCVYGHRHVSHGCKCYNIGLQFSNRSVPLLFFVKQTLSAFNFSPKHHGHGIYLFRESEVCRYAKEVGFSNPYHFKRLQIFLNRKSNLKSSR